MPDHLPDDLWAAQQRLRDRQCVVCRSWFRTSDPDRRLCAHHENAAAEVIRRELINHVGGWLDNGKPDKAHCACGHRPRLGELHADHVAVAVAAALYGGDA